MAEKSKQVLDGVRQREELKDTVDKTRAEVETEARQHVRGVVGESGGPGTSNR
jgi:hypothetical protein